MRRVSESGDARGAASRRLRKGERLRQRFDQAERAEQPERAPRTPGGKPRESLIECMIWGVVEFFLNWAINLFTGG